MRRLQLALGVAAGGEEGVNIDESMWPAYRSIVSGWRRGLLYLGG